MDFPTETTDVLFSYVNLKIQALDDTSENVLSAFRKPVWYRLKMQPTLSAALVSHCFLESCEALQQEKSPHPVNL